MSGAPDQKQLTSVCVILIGFFWAPGSRIRVWFSEEKPRGSS